MAIWDKNADVNHMRELAAKLREGIARAKAAKKFTKAENLEKRLAETEAEIAWLERN